MPSTPEVTPPEVMPEVIALDTILDGREYYAAISIIDPTTGDVARSSPRYTGYVRRPSGICRIVSQHTPGTQWKRVLSARVLGTPSSGFRFLCTLAYYSRRCEVMVYLTPRAIQRADRKVKDKVAGSYTRIDGKLKRVVTTRSPTPSKRKVKSYKSNFSKRWV